ncbi:MAG: nucleotide sugar dehydrogenase [Hyphomicrobiales bacterium]|nr:MAG: nucleotide sugar dehydrogenase [Hyphomicrobiales bacterium]
MPALSAVRAAVIGLGYVGLPLAVYLARKFPVVGFDINAERIGELASGIDRTREVTAEEMRLAKALTFSSNAKDMAACNFFVVTVPTPIDEARRPDLTPLEKASETVGSVIRPGSVVVFESTVYPGATEEICVPIIEKRSGLRFNVDFFAGYSPERINPGDHTRRLPNIRKVTSGSTPEAANLVDAVYAAVIEAGTYRASSIRVAEAAKVIENVQRDLNIALVNELAQLFKRLGIETREVLEAAGTKWNFHGYRPGLVGGHCIGVDPYYLTHKAQTIGFHPEIILAGRRVNDGMAAFVAHDIVKVMVQRRLKIGDARLLLMGFTFKENCPDTRNTKVADLVKELEPFASTLTVYDPHASPAEARHEYGIEITNDLPSGSFDGIILCVKHEEILKLGEPWMRKHLHNGRGFIYDLKEVLPVSASDARL